MNEPQEHLVGPPAYQSEGYDDIGRSKYRSKPSNENDLLFKLNNYIKNWSRKAYLPTFFLYKNICLLLIRKVGCIESIKNLGMKI